MKKKTDIPTPKMPTLPIGRIKAKSSKISGSFMRVWRRIGRVHSPASKVRLVSIFMDCENVPARYALDVIKYATRYGRVVEKLLYVSPSMLENPDVKRAIYDLGFEWRICRGFRAGKNSADITLTVDAMNRSQAGVSDDFVIVSSDSDYAPLARDLRKRGKAVHGMGLKSANLAFTRMFDTWAFLDTLEPSANRLHVATDERDELTELLIEVFWGSKKSGEWAAVADYANELYRRVPGFNVRRYGAKNISTLLQKTGVFEVNKKAGRCEVRLARNVRFSW